MPKQAVVNGNTLSSSAPRGAADAKPVQASNGHPPTLWWLTLREGLQLASQLILASPVRLPAKVVTAAKYVSVALGLWESLDARRPTPAGPAAGQSDEAEAADEP